MPDELDLEQGGGAEGGAEGGVSTQETARKLASAIAAGLKGSDQGKEAAAAQQAQSDNVGPVAQTPVEGAEVTPTGEETPEPPAQEETPTLSEIEQVLAETGLDLGITAAEVPAELMPVYERLVQSAVDVAQGVLAQQLEASDAMKRMQEFSKRIEESPDKLLLTMALNKPEIFAQVAEVVSQMQTDPRLKEIVIRELTAEARLREAERKEQSLDETDKRQKARQVIAATKRSARVHGVPYELAEEVIALAIQAHGGEFDVADVEDYVVRLKAAPRKPAVKPKVATPAQQQATRQAPTTEVAGSQGAPAASPGLSQDSTRDKGGGIFRRLVREANARLTKAGQ